MLHPEQGDDVTLYRHRVLLDPATGNTAFVLETTRESGGREQCVYLGPSGCTIYQRRPLLCRSFDCRKHYLTLPRQDRDNLVKLGLSSRAVFNAGRARLKTLSDSERSQCVALRDEFFS